MCRVTQLHLAPGARTLGRKKHSPSSLEVKQKAMTHLLFIFLRIIISYLHVARHRRTRWWSASLCRTFHVSMFLLCGDDGITDGGGVLVPVETPSYFPYAAVVLKFPTVSWPAWPSSRHSADYKELWGHTHVIFPLLNRVWTCVGWILLCVFILFTNATTSLWVPVCQYFRPAHMHMHKLNKKAPIIHLLFL